MNALDDFDTDQLLESAVSGDDHAADVLLRRYRKRIRTLVGVRLDSQMAGRIDASDVVQDVMVTAHRRLDDYLRDRPITFYAWLRQIALNRLTDLHRQHCLAEKRSVHREEAFLSHVNDESAAMLAERFLQSASSPSQSLMRHELKQQVASAMQQLPEEQREIIVMRHLEELSLKEIAAILEIPVGSVMSRHFRGLKALRRVLDV